MKPLKIAGSVKDMSPTIKNVYDLLIDGNMSKKQIANACSVDLDVVHTVAKKFKTGQLKECSAQNDKIVLEKDDTFEDTNSAEPEENKNNRKKLSDDIILQIWELHSNGVSKMKISDQLKISYSSVLRYINEYEESGEQNKPKTKTAEKRKGGIERKISPQKFTRYYKKVLNKEMSVADLMKKLDISNYTFYSYKKIYEKMHPQKKIKNIDPNESQIEETSKMQIPDKEDIIVSSKFELKRITFGNNIVCGLVNGRHEMPVSLFIFDNISNEDMFNYNLQEEICKKFITDHIEFKDGVSMSTMIVYTTGLQCALATLIKVTHKMQVNLIINHYNSDNGKYISQTIWDSFGNKMDDKYKFIENFIQNADRSLYTYDSTIEELMNQQEIYIISQSKMERSTKRLLCRDRIFIKNYENLWDLYTSAIKSINKNTKDLMSVNIYKAEKQSDGKFAQTSRICSSYNN